MKRRSKTVVPYQVQFDSEYKIGDVVRALGADGKRRVGTFTLMRQFGGKRPGWTTLRKWGRGSRYREENSPIRDEDIVDWQDFNKNVRQPKVVIPLGS